MPGNKEALNVVVVGGSLGGLFTAIALKTLGHHVRILERTPSALLQNQGAGIVAGGPTQQFFSRYDRTRTPIAVSSRVRQYLNRGGDVIDSEESTQQMTSWDLLYNILRANFDGNPAEGYCVTPRPEESDGGAEYLYGHRFTAVRDIGDDGVEVAFEDKNGKEGSFKANLLIGADGPSSSVRKFFEADVQRTYAGYVAWRGTVSESEVSNEARECFSEKFTFFHRNGVQILAYLIPGKNGTLKPGQRLINYVWYCNYPSTSSEYKDLMTDACGEHHHFTLPAGKMSPSIWASQQHYAASILPPQFSELVQKTKEPFIQAVTDVFTPRHVFMDGKVILVGDALAGLRPHTAASTSQAAMHALLLAQVMRGGMGLGEWQTSTADWAKQMSAKGIAMGDRSQFGEHELADNS